VCERRVAGYRDRDRVTVTPFFKCVDYCSTYYKAVRVCVGGGEQWRTCATRDYEPKPVCVLLLQYLIQVCVCVFIIANNSIGMCVFITAVPWCVCVVCVFYYCRTYYKAVRVGGGGEWRTCAMRDDEPRPVWMCVLLLQDLLQSCARWGRRRVWVCPSRWDP
jgi:hypothetical protein